MSAFDDEFGLFGDEGSDEEERTPTLGARRIASDEAAHDDIEPEDERPRRGRDRRDRSGGASAGVYEGAERPRRREQRDRGPRKAADPAVAQKRAVDLLGFLARKLVSRPDEVIVEAIETAKGPVIELEVHPDDLGKVIGRAGRVAQALRTLVRASAEGRVGVDIVDVEDDETFEDDLEHAGDTSQARAEEDESRDTGDAE
jgi:predicted RNA-binding protein YlqC (UPF0109 family)